MTKVTIDRELLEQVASEFEHDNDRCMLGRELRKVLDAPRQPEGDYGWLVNLELPEVQCNCAWNPDSHDKPCPVYLRDRMADAQRAIAELREECEHLKDCQENAMLHMTGIVSERDTLREECERLRGLTPEPPPRPPEGEGMPRYGLRWNGPGIPLSVPMDDGYWTPWHLAEAERDTQRQQLAELRAQLLAIASAEPRRHTIEWAKAMAATGNNEAYAKWREAFDQRDKLAGLLRHASSVLGSQGWDALTHEIDAALAKLEGKA